MSEAALSSSPSPGKGPSPSSLRTAAPQSGFAPWKDASKTPMVRFQNVVKRFGDFVAVKDCTLDIYEREFFALLGPSGCGKSSLLRAVAGPDDIACRLGGDEFCLLVGAHERDDVMRYADFVVATTRSLLHLQQAVPTICPVSVGACLVEPDQDWNDWYARADAALYEAKRLGGNRAFWIDGLTPLGG